MDRVVLGRALVIVNPVSGQGRSSRAWPRLSRLISSQGIAFDVAESRYPGDATTLARRALREGCDYLIVVGGDGTFNEVANGYFENGKPLNPDASLVPLSFGTGCDVARSLGLPKGFDAAARIGAGIPRRIDLGHATYLDHQGRETHRYFVNYADLVLGGETVERVESLPKAMGGFLTFLLGSSLAVLTHRSKLLRLQVDGAMVFDGRASLVVISNGSYFGGGMHIAPTASPEDGLFDVVILRGIGRGELIWNLPRVYRGAHIGDRRVLHLQGKTVDVTTEERVLIGMDGEQPGLADARFEIVPRALLVKV